MLDMTQLALKDHPKHNSHDNDGSNINMADLNFSDEFKVESRSESREKKNNSDRILFSPFKLFDKLLLYSPLYITYGRNKWINMICLCFIVCFETFYYYEDCQYFAQVYGSMYESDIILARIVLSVVLLIVKTLRLYLASIPVPRISKMLYQYNYTDRENSGGDKNDNYYNDRKSVINIRVKSPKVSMSRSFTDDGTVVVENNKMRKRIIIKDVIVSF